MEHLDETVAEQMKQTPMYQGYQRIAPRPQTGRFCAKKLGVMFQETIMTGRVKLSRIKVPVLLVFGDADAVRTAMPWSSSNCWAEGKKDGGWDGSGMSRHG